MDQEKPVETLGRTAPSPLLTELAGIGPARAARLARLGLVRVRDLLFLVPRRLEHTGERLSAAEARERAGAEVAVRGKLRGLRLFRAGRRRSVLSLDLADDSGVLRVLFFNQPWLFERLRALAAAGRRVELSGRIGTTKKGPALLAPRLSEELPSAQEARLRPVYPLTAGIGQEFLRKLALQALAEHGALADPLPAAELARRDLLGLRAALQAVHRPTSPEEFARGRARLALERLLRLQARLARSREEAASLRARPVLLGERERGELLAHLPFDPTVGQRRVLREIFADLERTRPMRRLLQGEVGAGKTLVALAACAAVVRAGGQAALLAPTELLCEQHDLGLRASLARFGVRGVRLTGSLRAREKRAALEELASGRAGLAIGTHALFSSAVSFARLDLVVIDEQQRFGVAQKRALLDKGRDVHALLMTATPIPRTLALCFYGDLETSLLAERPPGRGALETRVVPQAGRAELLAFLERRAELGERVFWVCPRIVGAEEDGEGDEERESRAQTASAERAFATLRAGALGPFGVELLHGRIPAERRSAAIERFRRGEARLLVGTSIVEVGVDVPEATVMVIEGAERFGLAQLHQLRGRVGRSSRRSWCFLLSAGEEVERLAFLESCHDGFAIAEEDLRRRGMGDLAGSRQAGENLEGLADPELDLERVRFARELVQERAVREHYLEGEGGAELV